MKCKEGRQGEQLHTGCFLGWHAVCYWGTAGCVSAPLWDLVCCGDRHLAVESTGSDVSEGKGLGYPQCLGNHVGLLQFGMDARQIRGGQCPCAERLHRDSLVRPLALRPYPWRLPWLRQLGIVERFVEGDVQHIEAGRARLWWLGQPAVGPHVGFGRANLVSPNPGVRLRCGVMGCRATSCYPARWLRRPGLGVTIAAWPWLWGGCSVVVPRWSPVHPVGWGPLLGP